MAEEVQYVSEAGSNKRKYDEPTSSPSPVSRRPTGFSGPISSLSPPDRLASTAPPPSAYNNVPPPMDDFQLAKQRAQEIAARLLINTDPKKPRVDNGGAAGPYETREPQKQTGSTFTSGSGSYGYPGPSKKIEIPNGRVGVIIGKSGETIKYLQLQSGAKIQVTRDMDADPNSQTRAVELMGTPEQVAKAEQLIQDVLSEADSGGSGIVSRRLTGQQSGAEQYVMQVPNNKVGLVIGKGGETIKNMQATTGARIQVIPLHLPPGDTSTERTVQIDGTSDQIEHAKQLVNEVISENRVRNQPPGVAYPPQQGYQARPPSNWAPPSGQMQQPGYGYMQPGTYPGHPPQYNMPQPPYPGYPPQPSSAGYGPTWDQSNSNPQTGGYDYYSQVPPQQLQASGGSGAPPTDNSAFGYSQQQSSGHNHYNQGHTYSQDGYTGYPALHPGGYAGGQTNTVSGYDQQQQGYFGNSTNHAQETQTSYSGTQGDGSQAPPPANPSTAAVSQQHGYQTNNQNPSPNANYPQPGYAPAPTSQGVGYGTHQLAHGTNYGQPPSQKPLTSQPAYGQLQQSPQVYPQPSSSALPGYGPVQTQTGYGPPTSYGGPPPMSQSGVPYNGTCGGGGGAYLQPPSAAYSSDVSATGASSQPAGLAKTSPQS
ncbi:unnamed protein product [Cuscuta epithymum]|uniref:K Homology domain-containing protein n=1 Tax=Cuscuta epithymum TaxID=186058 RepID=A0AAV0ETN8_9ASTE|nr:unnamed protein product [Cuscuta epithymum]